MILGGWHFTFVKGVGQCLVILQMQVANGQAISTRFTDTHVFLTRFTSLKGNCAGGTRLD